MDTVGAQGGSPLLSVIAWGREDGGYQLTLFLLEAREGPQLCPQGGAATAKDWLRGAGGGN